MTTYTIYGTNQDDTLSTLDYAGGTSNGFITKQGLAMGYDEYAIIGGEGDDDLRAWFIHNENPNRVDMLLGENGNDTFSTQSTDSPKQGLVITGGSGRDYLHIMGSPTFVGVYDRIEGQDATSISISYSQDKTENILIVVKDDVEYALYKDALTGQNAYLLTEDVAKGLNKQGSDPGRVSYNEMYIRTTDAAADWSSKGIDTYSYFHGNPLSNAIKDTNYNYFGSSNADNIIIKDLDNLYPHKSGFNIYAGAGNDIIINNIGDPKNRTDYIYGENGDDTITISTELVEQSYTYISGGNGSDSVVIAGKIGKNQPSFTRTSSNETILKFTIDLDPIEPPTGEWPSTINLTISDDIESIIFLDPDIQANGLRNGTEASVIAQQLVDNAKTYLTEDIANGRIRQVTSEESKARTTGENADWSAKGLDTYATYFNLPGNNSNEDINKPNQTESTEDVNTSNNNTNSISSIKYLSINENDTSIETFSSSENVTWSISGGEQNLFSINPSTGELKFKNPPDYEKPFEPEGTIIKFQTNYSTSTVAEDFYVELYDKQNSTNRTTPITANNFIKYINDGSYNQTIIHRLVPDFVIQSGGYTWPTKASNEIGGYPLRVTSKGEIINEAGNSNLMGTLAMAKLSGEPNSATSEWFINLANNISLNSQNNGFTVFGHILGDGIKNPLLLNDQSAYNVNFDQVGLNIPELPLLNVQGNVLNDTNYFAIRSINTVNERPNEIANKYNVIVTSTDSTGLATKQYVVVEVNDVIEINNQTIIDKITSTITTDVKSYPGDYSDYKFFNLGQNKYAIQSGNNYDEITGVSTIKFINKDFDVIKDIKGVFDQVTGLNTDDAKMFRLYNAAFARFPDADGLRYWIDNFSSGKDDERAVASSFLGSAEFKERYGDNVSNSKYVETLYVNVLGRDYDQSGYSYWLGNLNNGLETRHELLLGFSESIENKALFSEMTGFS